MNFQAKIDSLIDDAALSKQRAQMLGNFLKSGKAKKYLEPLDSLVCETISTYTWVGPDTLYVTITVTDLEGFTDPRLAGVLNVFEYMSPADTGMDEYPSMFTKEFRYTFKEEMVPDEWWGSVGIRVTVSARIKSDSETCHRVQIGMTEPTPQPIYKLVCDEPTTQEV